MWSEEVIKCNIHNYIIKKCALKQILRSSCLLAIRSFGLTIVANVAIATGPALSGARRSSVINPIYYIK